MDGRTGFRHAGLRSSPKSKSSQAVKARSLLPTAAKFCFCRSAGPDASLAPELPRPRLLWHLVVCSGQPTASPDSPVPGYLAVLAPIADA
jgi:hypothetical protein